MFSMSLSPILAPWIWSQSMANVDPATNFQPGPFSVFPIQAAPVPWLLRVDAESLKDLRANELNV